MSTCKSFQLQESGPGFEDLIKCNCFIHHLFSICCLLVFNWEQVAVVIFFHVNQINTVIFWSRSLSKITGGIWTCGCRWKLPALPLSHGTSTRMDILWQALSSPSHRKMFYSTQILTFKHLFLNAQSLFYFVRVPLVTHKLHQYFYM